MISMHTAGYLAVAASIGTLTTLFFYLPMLVIKIGNISDQVSAYTLIHTLIFSSWLIRYAQESHRLIIVPTKPMLKPIYAYWPSPNHKHTNT
jgi:hypothetical protein